MCKLITETKSAHTTTMCSGVGTKSTLKGQGELEVYQSAEPEWFSSWGEYCGKPPIYTMQLRVWGAL